MRKTLVQVKNQTFRETPYFGPVYSRRTCTPTFLGLPKNSTKKQEDIMPQKFAYCICTNKRPAAYNNISVWWWLIAIFAQKSPKKPLKGDFWPK